MIIGGLISSTLLARLVTPALYRLLVPDVPDSATMLDARPVLVPAA